MVSTIKYNLVSFLPGFKIFFGHFSWNFRGCYFPLHFASLSVGGNIKMILSDPNDPVFLMMTRLQCHITDC